MYTSNSCFFQAGWLLKGQGQGQGQGQRDRAKGVRADCKRLRAFTTRKGLIWFPFFLSPSQGKTKRYFSFSIEKYIIWKLLSSWSYSCHKNLKTFINLQTHVHFKQMFFSSRPAAARAKGQGWRSKGRFESIKGIHYKKGSDLIPFSFSPFPWKQKDSSPNTMGKDLLLEDEEGRKREKD